MATRQVSEGRQNQFVARFAIRRWTPPAPKGKAGQAQTIGAPAHDRHRVQVAAEIEETWPGFGAMAEPEGAKGSRGFPPQALEPTAPLMVAIDQPQRATQEFGQGPYFLP